MLTKATARLCQTGLRTLSVSTSRSKHMLPDLPYDYNALEPAISAETMKIHHQKHHQTYVTNLNIVEEKFHEAYASSKSGVILFNMRILYD